MWWRNPDYERAEALEQLLSNVHRMVTPTVFISYSHKDETWKNRLRPHLGLLEKTGRLTIWDDRSIDGGASWYPEIQKAMADARIAVCLISADYLNSSFCVKEEIPYLLQRRESEGMLLLPVLIRPCLWEAIDRLKAIQMLPRDGKAVARDFKEDWDTPFADVAKRVNSFLEEPKREVIEVVKPRWSPPEKIDIDRLPRTGMELFGRQKELEWLDQVWDNVIASEAKQSPLSEGIASSQKPLLAMTSKLNVVSLVAWGGVGKSTLVNKWLERMAADNYRGARRVFAWSFYSQGTSERVTSADLFIAEALKWFGDADPAQGSPWDKGGRLAELVRRERTLLVLDGMEPLQSSSDFERGKVKDPALATLITELARENAGLCVITTRECVTDLDSFAATAGQKDLEQISPEAGRALLRVGGVQGSDAELEEAARGFGPHALALNLLAAYLHEIKGHAISHAAEIPDLDVPPEKGKHPRRVMAAFETRFGAGRETDLLRVMGLFNSPAAKDALAAVRAAPPIPDLTEHLANISEADWMQVINRLRRVKLIAPESKHRPDTLDAHPLVSEHFGEQLKRENQDAWCEGNNRLYEYYKTIAKELPDTFEEMMPLFAAVGHGCQAGKYQEAFWDYYKRIQRDGDTNFCMSQLGAVGSDLAALSGFFTDTSWNKPVDELSEDIKGFILNAAGFRLRALGRLAEAAQPMQAGLDARIVEKNWKNAAISASNLSELYLTLGDVGQALTFARQSVELADQSGDWEVQMPNRTTLADALHQAGQLAEAEAAFHEAEELQKKRQPDFPLLYSLQGFLYCDLLMSQGKVQEVARRAEQAIKIAERNHWLLDIALDNLSLGRAKLGMSLRGALATKQSPIDEGIASPSARNDILLYLNRAVDGLRESGNQHELPRGLLARAEYYRVTGAVEKCQRDLDEAFGVASRGGMGLYVADCHLEYARLALACRRSPRPSPWEGEGVAREHLKTAKEMIAKMGYHRRDKDVEEIESLLRGAA